MDYEKKLREALVNGNADYEVVRWIEQTFPELKGSEDERIRGKIIATIHLYYGEPLEDEAKEMIAWLEKRGEQKPAFEIKTPEESLGIDSDTYNKIVDECVYGEQKPVDADLKDIVDKEANAIWKEINTGGSHSIIDSFNQFYGICMQVAEAVLDYQKPTWSDEDEQMLNQIIKDYERANESWLKGQGSLPFGNRIKWLKSLKERVQPQPKQEWSKEDNSHIQSILVRLEGMCEKGNIFTATRYALSEDINWLKSLKDRVSLQPKQEWSEKDEVALDDALWCCKQAASIAKDENEMGNAWYAERWLKSLRPQNTWKPSDEQMKALNEAMYHVDDSVATQIAMLIGELNKL